MIKIEIVKNGIVFSNDIYTILRGKNAIDFNYEQAGLLIPTEQQIQFLRQDFAKDVKRIFKDEVTIYSEEEMQRFMYESFEKNDDKPCVSLDKIYFDDSKIKNISYYLDCTRLDGEQELVSRKNPNDSGFIERQIEDIASKLHEKNMIEIFLIDDVVFSGNALRKIIILFEKHNIKVVGIRASISAKEAFDYFNKNLEMGLKCGCLLDENVIDQVCERDFYFGIAQSGISVRVDNKNVLKAPYFKPFGNPEKRASIPSNAVNFFSNGCLVRSMKLWDYIEKNSGRNIYVRDLPEKIINTDDNERIIDLLSRGLVYYEKDTNRSNGVSR